jgi:hypothetical protein
MVKEIKGADIAVAGVAVPAVPGKKVPTPK